MQQNDYQKYKRRQQIVTKEKASIDGVYPYAKLIEKRLLEEKSCYLMGVKHTEYIPEDMIRQLMKNGFYPHTIDKMARDGRAIDIDLVNPLTGKPMTGSSSGTAINVLEDYNDIGLGTDGGGSVLAPALALNLYGIISPLFYRDKTCLKTSTDGIAYTPSIGFISKDVSLIKKATDIFVKPEKVDHINVLLPSDNCLDYEGVDMTRILIRGLALKKHVQLYQENYPNIFGERRENMAFLRHQLTKNDVILSYEGPIDYHGLGDSVFGLFNEASKNIQALSKKGLIRVANMVDASALVVPSNDFSSGYVLIVNSTVRGIACLFEIEKLLKNKLNNPLYQRYFTINP